MLQKKLKVTGGPAPNFPVPCCHIHWAVPNVLEEMKKGRYSNSKTMFLCVFGFVDSLTF